MGCAWLCRFGFSLMYVNCVRGSSSNGLNFRIPSYPWLGRDSPGASLKFQTSNSNHQPTQQSKKTLDSWVRKDCPSCPNQDGFKQGYTSWNIMHSAIFPHSSIVFPSPSPYRSERLPGYVKSNGLTNLHEKHQDCHRTWHIDDWLGRMMGVSESQRYSFNEGTSQLNRKAATMRRNPGICFTWTWFWDQALDVLVLDRFFSLSHHYQHKHGIQQNPAEKCYLSPLHPNYFASFCPTLKPPWLPHGCVGDWGFAPVNIPFWKAPRHTSIRNMIHTAEVKQELQTMAPQTKPNSPMQWMGSQYAKDWILRWPGKIHKTPGGLDEVGCYVCLGAWGPVELKGMYENFWWSSKFWGWFTMFKEVQPGGGLLPVLSL